MKHTVTVGANRRFGFSPKEITIQPGDTVEWVCAGVPPHNIIFDPAKIPSGSGSDAKRLSHEGLMYSINAKVSSCFNGMPSGVYTYYCNPHRGAGEVGKIIVE